MNIHKILTMLVIVFGLVGCEQASTGFSLPIGDPTQGKDVFLSMQCLSCHEMEGFERPEGTEDKLSVTLGGKLQTLKTYAELVTSVINRRISWLKAMRCQKSKSRENLSCLFITTL